MTMPLKISRAESTTALKTEMEPDCRNAKILNTSRATFTANDKLTAQASLKLLELPRERASKGDRREGGWVDYWTGMIRLTEPS